MLQRSLSPGVFAVAKSCNACACVATQARDASHLQAQRLALTLASGCQGYDSCAVEALSVSRRAVHTALLTPVSMPFPVAGGLSAAALCGVDCAPLSVRSVHTEASAALQGHAGRVAQHRQPLHRGHRCGPRSHLLFAGTWLSGCGSLQYVMRECVLAVLVTCHSCCAQTPIAWQASLLRSSR